MTEITNSFKQDLDDLVRTHSNKVIDVLNLDEAIKCNIHSISYSIKLTDDIIQAYDLSSNISILCTLVQSEQVKASVKFLYNGYEIKPDGYYILPENHVDVSIRRIMQECIKQKTYKPDIRELQSGKRQ